MCSLGLNLLQFQACAAFILLHCAFTESLVKANGVGSVTFLEGRPGQYLRRAANNSLQGITFSNSDVSAAVAVLLGLTPPSSINQEAASKLNDLLSPDPFNRPHAVLMLTVKHLETESAYKGEKLGIIPAQHRELAIEGRKATFEIPEDVRLELLNTALKEEVDLVGVEQELKELSSVLGGSYQKGVEPLQGTLTVPLPSGDTSTLHLSKKADQKFALELVSLFRGITRAVSAQDDLDSQPPGEMFMGTFTGIEALEEDYHNRATTKQASELFIYVVGKMFTYIESANNGRLVGVIVAPSYNVQSADQEILDLKISTGPSRLLLEGSTDTLTAAVAELLTETVIAYFTGILFIVALIIATCFLFNMPLTRDTLLYSGAKLD